MEKTTDTSDRSDAVRVLLIRHGQSEANLQHRFAGQCNPDLTLLGRAQAEATAAYLADEPIAAIWSSDLLRAFHTATPHEAYHAVRVETSEALREFCAGDWEGKTQTELSTRYPGLYPDRWSREFGTFCPPGGEPIVHLAERVYDEIRRICGLYPGKTVCIVSHAGAIRAFWGKISGFSPEDVGCRVNFPTNASVSTCLCRNGVFSPLSYSEDSHLRELGTPLQTVFFGEDKSQK